MTTVEQAALRAESAEIAARRQDAIQADPVRRYTVITSRDGQLLLDEYADGSATLAEREFSYETWGPPRDVTVVHGTDPASGAS